MYKQNNKLDLFFELVKTSFILKYNGSVLGFVWVLLKPFLQFTILYVVFSRAAANSSIDNYTIYLLTGLIVFSFVQEAIHTGIHSLLEKANIILKVNFDKTLVIYSNIALGFINFFVNMIILIGFIVFNPVNITPFSLLYFGIIILVILLLVTGISFITSIVTVKIRDVQHIVEVAMQLMFYATPIFYSIEILPERVREIMKFNPLFIIIQAVRDAIIKGEINYEKEILVLGILGFVLFLIGNRFFVRAVKKITEFF